MSELEDESSCSLPEDDEVKPENPTSFFHVQPPSLSQGYEICGSPYDSSEITKKIKSTKFRLREYENWLGFKKPLDERRLRQAVSMNDTASVIHLLCKGVSANCCDDLRRSPLHLASCKGYTRIVRPTLLPMEVWTPLKIQFLTGKTQILLDHGADPNARDSIGNTPLHLAACTNHIDIIMLLLQAGSDGLSVDKLGRSPLQLAQSKLKILQKSNVTDEEVKQQVSQVIELLLMFAHDGADTEKLSEARDRVKVAGSREQVDMELRSLLDNLESLSISKPNT